MSRLKMPTTKKGNEEVNIYLKWFSLIVSISAVLGLFWIFYFKEYFGF